MVSDPEVVVRLARLTKELDADTAALDARGREIGELTQAWATGGRFGAPELVLLAVNLHGWYTALETALEARRAPARPDGASGKHLARRSAGADAGGDSQGVRPCVVPGATIPELHELRKFRHFFRNAYVLDLDPTLVRERAEALLRIRQPVVDGMSGLRAHIVAAIAELSR